MTCFLETWRRIGYKNPYLATSKHRHRSKVVMAILQTLSSNSKYKVECWDYFQRHQ